MSVLTRIPAQPDETRPVELPPVPGAIAQLLQQLADSLNQQHWPVLARCFATDALLVNLLGDRAEGQAAILQYQQGMAALFPERLVHYQLISCQLLSCQSLSGQTLSSQSLSGQSVTGQPASSQSAGTLSHSNQPAGALYLLNVQQQWLCRRQRQPQGVSSCPLFVVRLDPDGARILGCNSL